MKNHSMLSEIWRRFKKNKQALVGLIVLILFVLIAIFADQIAPYGYDAVSYTHLTLPTN